MIKAVLTVDTGLSEMIDTGGRRGRRSHELIRLMSLWEPQVEAKKGTGKGTEEKGRENNGLKRKKS